MANQSSNTTTLNRRKMFSASAALAVAGVSTVALAKAGMAAVSGHPDRALFEAIAEWRVGHEEQERLCDIQCRLEDLAGETEPPIPSELFEALDMPDEKRLPDMSLGWLESSLRNFVESGQVLLGSTEKLPNSIRTDMWWDDISPATRQRAAELLQVRLDYTEKQNAHWKEAEEAEVRFSDQVSKQSDRMIEIVEMSVYTGEGLAAKCQMLLAEPMFADMTGKFGSEAGFIAKSLIADIQEAVNRGAFTA